MSAGPDAPARALNIDVERLDGGAIVVVTINRPHRRNALDSQTLAELHRLLDTLNGDAAARAVADIACTGNDQAAAIHLAIDGHKLPARILVILARANAPLSRG